MKSAGALKLGKPLCGLKKASNFWHNRLKKNLFSCGLEQSKSYPCLFVWKVKNGSRCYVLVCVDEILIAGQSKKDCQIVIESFRKSIEFVSVNEAHLFPNMEVGRNRKKTTVSLTQLAHVEKILARFRLEECVSKYPMRTDLDFRKATQYEQKE